MTNAVDAVKVHGMSIRKASNMYDVPRSSLMDRVSGRVDESCSPGRPTTADYDLERKLVDYACNLAEMGVGISIKVFLEHAGSLMKKHGLNVSRFKNGIPGEKWWRCFKKRHPDLRLRAPEPTAAVRHRAMNKTNVDGYFAKLEEVLERNGLQNKPHQIWNQDESGISLDHKPGRVLARKGIRNLQARTSGNKEQITILACGNAAGEMMPPHFIVKGKTSKTLLSMDTDKAPPGSKFSCSDSGWTKQGIGELWFKTHFLPHIGPEQPQLLIMDQHDSHGTLEIIECARQENIIILLLPPHTTHWLQPMDRSIFGPFKKAWNSICQDFMNENPGVIVSKVNFCQLFSKAWQKSITEKNVSSGFEKCGIFPCDRKKIPDRLLPHHWCPVGKIQLYLHLPAQTTFRAARNKFSQ
ncbi:uncharacterized protein LOC121379282 [Gigantopelta aegis]|uniref:uncharacterized protein LOC121379282 n=1 Tax=Gigantopelta aegis TaxID=1735272 RepID=UPI001B88A712|nr:uncharacterized protein LOC121379282 [Gigantopelta aegis]